MEFDEANLLARALGTNLDKQDPAMKSIATFKTDKVSLAERERPDGGGKHRRKPNSEDESWTWYTQQ